jgi:hypothetical protein
MTDNGTIHLTQPHLIDKILKDLSLTQANTKSKDTPAKSSQLLNRDKLGEDFDGSFHYRSVIGKLIYLEKATRRDIAYISHQCARFTESPKACHARALRWLGKYLLKMRNRGLILKPQKGNGLEVYVDADFSRNWDPKLLEGDQDTACSRHGYIIMNEGCPMI